MIPIHSLDLSFDDIMTETYTVPEGSKNGLPNSWRAAPAARSQFHAFFRVFSIQLEYFP